MSKKIVIAGGTGFVRKYLTTQYLNPGYQVFIISRQKENIQWDDTQAIIKSLENSELLINHTGKSVNCRLNEKNQSEILLSRTETTKTLGEVLLKCKHPPERWINSSTATTYRHAEDRALTESTGEIGKGFSVDVANSWEKKLKAVYYCSSPHSFNNETLMQPFRKVMPIKIGLPASAWLLAMGAFMINTATELILKSRWVVPEKILKRVTVLPIRIYHLHLKTF